MYLVVAVTLAAGGPAVILAVGLVHAAVGRRPGPRLGEPARRWLGVAGRVAVVIGCAATVVGAALLTAMSTS